MWSGDKGCRILPYWSRDYEIKVLHIYGIVILTDQIFTIYKILCNITYVNVYPQNRYNEVMVEKQSYIFVIGSQLDYVESLLMSGFELNNPNIKKSCSCGASFAI